jgi:hypothetical protein
VSVLLRQPHGFEGFRVVPEDLGVEDPSLAQRVDGAELHARLAALEYARQSIRTTTRSLASMKLVGSNASVSQASPSCPKKAMAASRPTNGPDSGHPSTGLKMVFGSCASRTASISFAFQAAKTPCTNSTFSCDIAYSPRPRACRASVLRRYSRTSQIFPSRREKTHVSGAVMSLPLLRSRP